MMFDLTKLFRSDYINTDIESNSDYLNEVREMKTGVTLSTNMETIATIDLSLIHI